MRHLSAAWLVVRFGLDEPMEVHRGAGLPLAMLGVATLVYSVWRLGPWGVAWFLYLTGAA